MREIGDFTLVPQTRTIWLGGQPLVLTRSQYEILTYLLARADQVVTSEEIAQAMWGDGYEFSARSGVSVHVHHIRRALGESGGAPRYLRTIRGYGYLLSADGTGMPCPPPIAGSPDTSRPDGSARAQVRVEAGPGRNWVQGKAGNAWLSVSYSFPAGTP